MMIVGCIYLVESYFSWPLYLLGVVVIGSRYLALGVLMHEAVHGLIARNRRLNDFLAEVFCAWPLLFSMRSYRVKHLAHHTWLNTNQDPDHKGKEDMDWVFPMHVSRFMKMVLIQISGLGIFETFKVMTSGYSNSEKDKTPRSYHIARALYYTSVIGTIVYLGYGIELLLYWFIPLVTWTQLINRFRRIAEHSVVGSAAPELKTRTILHNPIAAFIFAPHNVSYHLAHHLFPGVPWYRLPELHWELDKHELARDNMFVSKSYVDVARECLTIDRAAR